MLYEVYKQLQGRVEERRQIRRPRIGLTHSVGGSPLMSVSGIAIVGNEL
jgi:hypothetical protein